MQHLPGRETVAAGTRHYFDFSKKPIVLGTGQSFSIGVETGTAAITHMMLCYHWVMTNNIGD